MKQYLILLYAIHIFKYFILFHFLKNTAYSLLIGFNSQFEKHWLGVFQIERIDWTHTLITSPFRDPIKMVIKEQSGINPQEQRAQERISTDRSLQ